MAEAGLMQQLLTAAMANPDVFFLGAAGGALIAWWRTKSKYKNSMGMGF
jgi:hypothetical protein